MGAGISVAFNMNFALHNSRTLVLALAQGIMELVRCIRWRVLQRLLSLTISRSS